MALPEMMAWKREWGGAGAGVASSGRASLPVGLATERAGVQR